MCRFQNKSLRNLHSHRNESHSNCCFNVVNFHTVVKNYRTVSLRTDTRVTHTVIALGKLCLTQSSAGVFTAARTGLNLASNGKLKAVKTRKIQPPSFKNCYGPSR